MKKTSKKDGGKEKKQKKEKLDKKGQKKKSVLALPPEFQLGARAIITDHNVGGMRERRCIILGTSQVACKNCHQDAKSSCPCDEKNRCLLVHVKLEGESRQSELDTSYLSAPEYLPQRAMSGVVSVTSQHRTARIELEKLKLTSPVVTEEDSKIAQRKSKAAYWCAAILGATKGDSILSSRKSRRVRPQPAPSKKKTKQKDSSVEPEALPELQSEMGALLHRLGMGEFEKSLAIKLGYRTISMMRALTPQRYIKIAQKVKMSRQQALKLRERGLAPENEADRAIYPIFGSF